MGFWSTPNWRCFTIVLSTRTIFLLIRGIDQTGRALTDPTKKMNELEKAQANLARSGYRLLFAGAAFTAFGAMATRALLGTLEGSTRGARVLNDFNTAVNRLKKAVGESIVDNFGDTLEGWIDSLDKLANDDFLTGILGGAAFELSIGITKIGFALIGTGVFIQFLAWITGAFVQAGLMSQGAASTVLGGVGAVGTAGLVLVITADLLVNIGKIAFTFLPEQLQEAVNEMKLKQIETNTEWVMPSLHLESGGDLVQQAFGGMTGFDFISDVGGLAKDAGTTINMFVDGLYTTADEETLTDFLQDIWLNIINSTGSE